MFDKYKERFDSTPVTVFLLADNQCNHLMNLFCCIEADAQQAGTEEDCNFFNPTLVDIRRRLTATAYHSHFQAK